MSNVADVKRKVAKITLDGKEHELKLTLNALVDLEDSYGSVDTAFEQLKEGKLKAIRCVLWAAMSHEDNPLSEKEVGNLINAENMQEIMSELVNIVGTDMPEEKLEEAGDGAVVAFPNV